MLTATVQVLQNKQCRSSTFDGAVAGPDERLVVRAESLTKRMRVYRVHDLQFCAIEKCCLKGYVLIM